MQRKNYLKRTGPLRRGKVSFKKYHPINTRQGLVDALDDVVSKLVRKRDNFTCITCGCTDESQLTCSHFYRRSFYATRWRLDNLATQCFICNVNHSERSVFPYLHWLLKRLSEDEFVELSEARMSRFTMSNSEMRAMLQSYRCQLRGMR